MAENLSIGEAILIHRKRSGLSQTELAVLVDVSKSTISNYESGKTQPTFELLIKIARSLDVPLSALVPFISEASPAAGKAIPVFDPKNTVFASDKLSGEHEYIALRDSILPVPGTVCGIKHGGSIMLFANTKTYTDGDTLLCTAPPRYKVIIVKYAQGAFYTLPEKKRMDKAPLVIGVYIGSI